MGRNLKPPVSPVAKVRIQVPVKLIITPINCLLVVSIFQINKPIMMIKIGNKEFIIPAILLETFVSAIGKRNIGIKLPETAARINHFIPFLIQNYWNNNTENLSIREVHKKF